MNMVHELTLDVNDTDVLYAFESLKKRSSFCGPFVLEFYH